MTRSDLVCRAAEAIASNVAGCDMATLIHEHDPGAARIGFAAKTVAKKTSDFMRTGLRGGRLIHAVADVISRTVANTRYEDMRNGTRDDYRRAATESIVGIGHGGLLYSIVPTQRVEQVLPPSPPASPLHNPEMRRDWLVSVAGSSAEALRAKTRSREEVAARTAIAYCLRAWVVDGIVLSYPHISQMLGRGNHSMVITAVQRVWNRPEAADLTNALIAEILKTGLGRVDRETVREHGGGKRLRLVDDGLGGVYGGVDAGEKGSSNEILRR